MRQLAAHDMGRGFEDIAQVAPSVRPALELFGVVFAENRYDEAGPTRWARLALEDGTQYLLIHHYAHPESFVDVRAIAEDRPPKELVDLLVTSLGLRRDEVRWIADRWWHHGDR